MKRAASLKRNFLIFLAVTCIGAFNSNSASGAIYSISQPSGNAAHAPSLWGQTFLVPVGYSGTISSVKNLVYQGYSSSTANVIWAKIWDSSSKSTLLGTSLNTFTGTVTPSGWGPAETFSLNFAPISVTGGSTYFLEIGRSAGNGNFYLHESGTNPYAGGSVFLSGVANTSYDLKFLIEVDTTPIAAVAPTVSFSSTANKGVAMLIMASASVPGTVKFRANGKNISKCQKVSAVGSPLVATCTWKPAIKGLAQISVQLFPSDLSSYSPSPVTDTTVLVGSRTNTR